jgi:hypothetical protein
MRNAHIKSKGHFVSLRRLSYLGVATIFSVSFLSTPISALPYTITYPIIGSSRFSDDFNASRSDGIHGATDVFANKMQKIVSPVDGTIIAVPYPQPSYGYYVSIRDAQNYRYNFIHINNDSPGTDNGNAQGPDIFGPDLKVGNPVVKGQLIAYVGDSGNAETTASHLHFEIVKPDGSLENPFGSLVYGNHSTAPSVYPTLSGENLPYGNGTNTTVQVAMGNFGLSANQYVTGPGAGGGPHVLVFRQDGGLASNFFAYDQSFQGGIDVTAGDVDGDGTDEIITGTGPNSGSHVKVFEPDGHLVSEFFAYPGYDTGVNVTAGDVDGDGNDEIITGTGPGWGTHVKVFETNGTLVSEFFAYPGNNVGVDVASGDVNNDGKDEIVTAAGPGGGSHIITFKGDGSPISSFFAYDGFHGGVRVSVGDVRTTTPQEEILTTPYTKGGPDVRLYNSTGGLVAIKAMFEPWWSGNYDPAAGVGKSMVGTGGNRRASVRLGIQ